MHARRQRISRDTLAWLDQIAEQPHMASDPTPKASHDLPLWASSMAPAEPAAPRSFFAAVVDSCRARPRTIAGVGSFLAAMLLGAALFTGACRASGAQSLPTAERVSMTTEPDVRVRIRSNISTTKIGGPAKFGVQPLGSSGPAGRRSILNGPITAVGTRDGVRLTDAKGIASDFPGPAGVEIIPDNPNNDPKRWATVDAQAYPGKLRIIPRDAAAEPEPDPRGDTKPAETKSADPKAKAAPKPPGTKTPPTMRLDVIEVVGIESYLIGVVPSEMFPDWGLTAFKVQAVCARTYALHERSRSIALNQSYDLESTTADQAYSGGNQLATAVQAVKETRGIVLTTRGDLLRAYYSSTCGGRNSAAADVWPTTRGFEFNLAGPIQASVRDHACQTSKWYRWEVTRDRLQLTTQFRTWAQRQGHPARDLALLEAIEPTKFSTGGRPGKYRLRDERGRGYELTAEELRIACNTSAAAVPAVTNATRVRSGDVEVAFDGPRVTIKGRGFGHGVGMCQYCAKGFADKGEEWETITRRFYPGAKLERAY